MFVYISIWLFGKTSLPPAALRQPCTKPCAKNIRQPCTRSVPKDLVRPPCTTTLYGTLSEGLHLAPNIWPYTCPSRPWPGGQIRPKIRMTLPVTSLMRLYPTLPYTQNILQYIHPSPPIPRRVGTCTPSRHPTLTNEDIHPAPPTSISGPGPQGFTWSS